MRGTVLFLFLLFLSLPTCSSKEPTEPRRFRDIPNPMENLRNALTNQTILLAVMDLFSTTPLGVYGIFRDGGISVTHPVREEVTQCGRRRISLLPFDGIFLQESFQECPSEVPVTTTGSYQVFFRTGPFFSLSLSVPELSTTSFTGTTVQKGNVEFFSPSSGGEIYTLRFSWEYREGSVFSSLRGEFFLVPEGSFRYLFSGSSLYSQEGGGAPYSVGIFFSQPVTLDYTRCSLLDRRSGEKIPFSPLLPFSGEGEILSSDLTLSVTFANCKAFVKVGEEVFLYDLTQVTDQTFYITDGYLALIPSLRIPPFSTVPPFLLYLPFYEFCTSDRSLCFRFSPRPDLDLSGNFPLRVGDLTYRENGVSWSGGYLWEGRKVTFRIPEHDPPEFSYEVTVEADPLHPILYAREVTLPEQVLIFRGDPLPSP